MGEQILEDFSKTKPNLQIICLRYFNPIGAHPSAQIGELPNGTPNNLLPYITQTAMGLQEKLTVLEMIIPLQMEPVCAITSMCVMLQMPMWLP